jgi:sec-independent protein translocase protein TatA
MNFLGMGPGELLLILFIAVIIVGPNKLPEYAKQAGKFITQIRKMTSDFTSDITNEVGGDPELKQTYNEIRQTLGSVKRFSLTDVLVNTAVGPAPAQQASQVAQAAAAPQVGQAQVDLSLDQLAEPTTASKVKRVNLDKADDIEEDLLLGEDSN